MSPSTEQNQTRENEPSSKLRRLDGRLLQEVSHELEKHLSNLLLLLRSENHNGFHEMRLEAICRNVLNALSGLLLVLRVEEFLKKHLDSLLCLRIQSADKGFAFLFLLRGSRGGLTLRLFSWGRRLTVLLRSTAISCGRPCLSSFRLFRW